MSSPLLVPAAVAALLLAAAHPLAPLLHVRPDDERSRWLSFAGGVAVAYVFVHLLPELASGQEHLEEVSAGWAFGFAERHVYLIALLGLLVFYGLERMAKRSRGDEAESSPDTERAEAATGPRVFWIHLLSFAAYNALIGYLLLHVEPPTTGSLALFATAMALHFIVNDVALAAHHRRRYHRFGRWVLAAAVIAGWAAAALAVLPRPVIAVLVAFLAGGIILNVMKEELPSERRSRFWALALGAIGYSALLLAV